MTTTKNAHRNKQHDKKNERKRKQYTHNKLKKRKTHTWTNKETIIKK